MTTTWFSRMTCSRSSLTSYTGSSLRCSAMVLLFANSLTCVSARYKETSAQLHLQFS
jgi:hypothetical protein